MIRADYFYCTYESAKGGISLADCGNLGLEVKLKNLRKNMACITGLGVTTTVTEFALDNSKDVFRLAVY